MDLIQNGLDFRLVNYIVLQFTKINKKKNITV